MESFPEYSEVGLMSRTITVLGETEVVNGGTRRRFYVVTGSSWTNLDSTAKHPDLATVAKNRFVINGLVHGADRL